MSDYTPFNPLDKTSLGVSVADALLSQTLAPLPPANSFDGAGVYALYYFGSSELYVLLAKADPMLPIYVGKAVPGGSRKGSKLEITNPGPCLYRRLREHAKSLNEVSDLNVSDFKCRYLSVDDVWIALGEALLIRKYKPLWNTVVDGFGIHTPGKGRKKQQRSPWDELHPGRHLASGLPANQKGREYFVRLVKENLAQYS